MDSKPEKPYSVEIEYFRQLIFSPSQKRKEEGQRQQPSDFHLFKRKTLEVIEEVIEEEIDLPVIIKKDNENDSKELIINIPNLMSDHNSAEEEIPGDSYEKNIICDQPIPQSSFSTLRQMIIPFIFAGIGEVCAGIILNNVQNWPAYNAIPQFLVMLPAICGLIGNIETTLSSRLSTHSNLGTLDNFSDAKSLVIGNAAVVLCQASTVGIFAAFASLFMSYITNTSRESITPMNVLLLTSSAATTSIIVNIILGTVLNVIVITSRKLKVNPGINFRVVFFLQNIEVLYNPHLLTFNIVLYSIKFN
jgi:cation transporter-like permease